MGVFARLFRRSRTAEGTRTDEVRDGRTAAAPRTEDAAGTARPKTSAEAPGTAGPAAEETGQTGGAAGTDDVEIPKQQSSGAADSEAGKGAHT